MKKIISITLGLLGDVSFAIGAFILNPANNKAGLIFEFVLIMLVVFLVSVSSILCGVLLLIATFWIGIQALFVFGFSSIDSPAPSSVNVAVIILFVSAILLFVSALFSFMSERHS